MDKNYESIRFGDIATFRNGLNFTSESNGKGCHFIGISDFKNRYIPDYDLIGEINPEGIAKEDDYLQQGDILFVRSNGNKELVGRSLYINSGVSALYSGFCIRARILSSQILPEFCAYFAKTDLFKKYISYADGTNINNLNQDILSNVKIPLIPLYEQNLIVKVLSNLNSKIEFNKRIYAELEEMAKLVYNFWFVQFDFPFDFAQGKPADEASRPEDIKPYKISGGKMVWNKELKREIPERWEVKAMDYWIEKDKNGDWGKEEIEGNYDLRVSCIRGADINGLNGNGELKSPLRFILDKNKHKILEPGDLVIEISGGSPTQSTGRLGYIINETLERFNEPIICSNFCKAITLKEESNQFNFIYEWKRLYDAGIFFSYEGKTSGIKNFLFESFVSKHKIVIPPEELTEKFYEKVLPIHSKIQKNLIQNQELSSLRDWLLPMLMNGQVTVAEAEERVEEELGMVAEKERFKYSLK